jgi:hypothetical protein
LEGRGAKFNADKKEVLDQLIAKGFVAPADQDPPAKYKLTGKAQQILAERGVGLSGGKRRVSLRPAASENPLIWIDDHLEFGLKSWSQL